MSECDPKPYTCNHCGFVLGFTVRGNDRRTKLNVLRHGALFSNLEKLGPVSEINFAVSDMEQGTVRCGFCGASRTWRMSDQAMDDLLGRRKERTFGLEVEHG